MTSGFEPLQRLEWRPRETRFYRHRSGIRRRTSIYREYEIGDSVKKVIWADIGAEMYWLLICDRVRRGGVSDSRAVNDEFHAAIALAAIGGVIRSDGLRFSKAARGNG
jgi:hypothetical protein